MRPPASPRAGGEDAELAAAARALVVDAMTASVVGALREDGVEPVLLKGPVLDEWLYAAGEQRPYGDCDLLVAPDRYTHAEAVLTELGFRRAARSWEGRHRVEHDAPWVRAGDQAVVDLHRTLPGVRGVAPEAAWATIAPRTLDWRLPDLPVSVKVLDEPARALLLCLHVAHHLEHAELAARPRADLERALARVAPDTWQDAAALAAQLHAAPQLARGLHAVPGGGPLAAELGLPAPSSGRAPAAGFERLAAAHGWRAKLSILGRSLAPSPAYLRWSAPLARRGPAGLAAAYLTRPLRLARGAREGYRAWRSGS